MTDPFKGIPKSIRIMGKRYRLLVVDKVDEDNNYGEHQIERQEIKLRRGDHGFEQARDTALHEVIHGVEEQLSLNLKEKQVHRLAVGLLQVLRENPAWTRWLLATETED